MNAEINQVRTRHNLDFEVLPWHDPNFTCFKVGTCHGLWWSTKTSYEIISVINDTPGNGHLDDVFEWFEYSCKRDKKSLRVIEIMNPGFMKHLIKKRGFRLDGIDSVVKDFK